VQYESYDDDCRGNAGFTTRKCTGCGTLFQNDNLDTLPATPSELQRLVNKYITDNPGKEGALADVLKVSRPTVDRWREGKNLPQPLTTRAIVTILTHLLVIEPHPQG